MCPDAAEASIIYLLAGIGNPDRFFRQCRELLEHSTPDSTSNRENASIVEIAMQDHHSYVAGEIEALLERATNNIDVDELAINRVLLVTEKDAVKLERIAIDLPVPVYAIGLEVELDPAIIDIVMGSDVRETTARHESHKSHNRAHHKE
mgnify:CR=1 FL=1